jgi:hypothetical protein
MASAAEIHKVFDRQESIRIIICVYTTTLNSADYISSASEILRNFVPEWEQNSQIRMLAVEVYSRHTYIAVDVNNHSYEFGNAHKDTTLIPVYGIRQVKRTDKWLLSRLAKEDKTVAERIAELHNVNGAKEPPFLEDHTSLIQHLNLRDPQM